MSSRFNKFRKKDIEQSIPNRFEMQVALHPARTAVIQDNHIYTYDSLNRIANRVANSLSQQSLESEKPVAFLIEHGVMQIISMLGILKAGRIYVPLDPDYPHAMIKKMLTDSEARIIITNNRNKGLAKKLAQNKIRLLNISELDTGISDKNSGRHISPDRFANIYYTSGSTGIPKGVLQNHRNVLHFIMNITNTWRISADDRIAHVISCSFSASMLPSLGALLNGAAVIPYDLAHNGLSHLEEFFIKERISIFFTVPSVFRQFAASLKAMSGFSDLRLIVFTGETLYKKDIELFKKYFSPKCMARNLLGGTEMHYVASLAIDRNTEIRENIIPAGYMVKDKEILILDEEGQHLGADITGEIVMKSRYLSPGYWQKPDLTRAVFLPDPDGGDERLYMTGDVGRIRSDGCLELLGRKDNQVKIKGQRIEIGEVETALLDLENISQAVVSARQDGQGDKYLVAYIVPRKKPAPMVDIMRKALKKTLPEYKIPSFFVVLEALPFTPNGKIDRQALPKPEKIRPDLDIAFVAPRNELESDLVRICEEVIGIHPVGVKDDLFDLGMDSLLYFSLLLEIENRFDKKLPDDVFVEVATIEGLTNLLAENNFASFSFPSKKSAPVVSVPTIFSADHHNSEKPIWIPKSLYLFRFSVAKLIGVFLPFSVAIRFTAWICSQGWAQAVFLARKKVRLIRRSLSLIDSSMNESDVFRNSLVCNYFNPWLLGTIPHIQPQRFDSLVTVTGLETFEASYRKGHGIVLVVSHYGIPHLDLFVLNRMGFKDIATQAIIQYELELMHLTKTEYIEIKVESLKNFAIRSVALYKSREVLLRGGVVRMAADGLHGTSGISIPFLGRMRFFRSGFAELSVSTGADVIPVFTSIDVKGRFKVDFLTPLHYEHNDRNWQQKINTLVKKYLHLLERRWAEEPGNILWGMLEHYMTLPPANKEKTS